MASKVTSKTKCSVITTCVNRMSQLIRRNCKSVIQEVTCFLTFQLLWRSHCRGLANSLLLDATPRVERPGWGFDRAAKYFSCRIHFGPGSSCCRRRGGRQPREHGIRWTCYDGLTPRSFRGSSTFPISSGKWLNWLLIEASLFTYLNFSNYLLYDFTRYVIF